MACLNHEFLGCICKVPCHEIAKRWCHQSIGEGTCLQPRKVHPQRGGMSAYQSKGSKVFVHHAQGQRPAMELAA